MPYKSITQNNAMRYARHIMLSGFDIDKQESLLNSRVLIIGLGGLGCAAAQYLAASGVGQLCLVDDDLVELSNLQRQVLHFEANQGSKKVVSAKATLQQINSEIDINIIKKRLDDDALALCIAEHDIVIDCSDNLSTRNQINRIAYKQGKPLVSGAAIRMEGQVFCSIPSENTSCYECLSQFFSEQILTCSEAGVMSPLVGIVGASQALEAIKILCKYGQALKNTLLVYDAMASQWHHFTVKPMAKCQVCQA